MKGAKRIVLLTLAGGLLLGTVIVAVLNRVEGGKRDALVAELRAEGVLLDRKAIASTRPAGTEFYSGPWESSLYGFLFSAEAGGDTGNPENASPFEWSWYKVAENPYRVFCQPCDDDEDIQRVLNEQQELIAKLKTLTAQAPMSPDELCRHTMRWCNAPGKKALHPWAVRAFANLLVLEAYGHCRCFEADKALADCCAILRLARHVADMPWLGAQDTACDVVCTGLECLQGMGPNNAYSEAAIAEMDDLLANLFEHDLLAKSLQAEMLSIKESFDNIGGMGTVPVWSICVRMVKRRLNPLTGLYFWLCSTPVLSFMHARDEATALGIMAHSIALNRLPFHQRDAAHEQFRKSAKGFRWHMAYTDIELMRRPDILATEVKAADARTLMNQGRIALALNRHRRVHGCYPETLDALVPTFLQRIPEDPYTGLMMTYEKTSKGYTLSSNGYKWKREARTRAKKGGGMWFIIRELRGLRGYGPDYDFHAAWQAS